MARSSFLNHAYQTPAVADFNAYFKAYSDMLKAVLTQTTDTGQVNWATNTTFSTTAGGVYEVYRLNDPLQSTAPLFMRFDYYYISGSPNRPMFNFTIGSGTNGAGTITNVFIPSFAAMTSQAGDGSLIYNDYASNGDGSQLMLVGLLTLTGTAVSPWFALTVERFRNADGTPSGDGFNLSVWIGGVLQGHYARTFAGLTYGAQAVVEVTPPMIVPYGRSATTFFTGNTEYAIPWSTYGPALTTAVQPMILKGTSQAIMYGLAADYPRVTPINVTLYGRAMQFLCLGIAANLSIPVQPTVSTAALTGGYSPLFRWE